MQLDLNGKTALITGGSKGIGLACAQSLLSEGARVVICSRSQANIDAALAKLPGTIGFTADLISENEALTLIDKIEADVGTLDILVNCAGAARRTPPQDLSPAHWRAAMDAKYFSYINVIDPVVKRMAARRTGVIVNVIGGGGKVASPIHLPGGAANAALMLATVGLANAYAASGLRIVGINPGNTETERVTEGLRAEAALHGISEQAALEKLVQRIPLGRMATPDEIANVVTFLSSSKASYVTGVVIGMDGALNPIVV
ncbi:SDR family NAD(P)-dependent oxidoreductase [Neorhizobium galegae]|uniref:Short-chain dehydrogenase/reductase SDR n=1 Tax=Neorhizobium galegae bv. officinalis TaxID=323656 RepID=A0A0T7GNQ8_NEOGA|nr:SDR family oxidoreductase [Neorhizobium galegae]CDZ48933.1 Short-chain dehydrogenase/reductase SDR [Neorhizobium galegae bv. officinalis]